MKHIVSSEPSLAGAGMYAELSSGLTRVALPNNSAVVWESRYYFTYRYSLDLYCMSNSTSNSSGTVILTDHSVGNPETSFCGVGCLRIHKISSRLQNFDGIHTCRILDSQGTFLDVNFGIYFYRFKREFQFIQIPCC